MPLDTCICGSCEQTFTDLNDFIAHKQAGCSTSSGSASQEHMTQSAPIPHGAKVIQMHMDEAGDITRLETESGHDGEDNNNGNGTMTFLSDVNLDTALDSPNDIEGQGHAAQGPGVDSSSSQTLIILKNEPLEEGADPIDGRNISGTVLSGLEGTLEGTLEGLAGSQLVNQVQDGRTTTLVISPEQFAEMLRKQQQQQPGANGQDDGVFSEPPPPKKRRVARAKKGEGKHKVIEAVPPSKPRPAAPETNADGTLSCPQCKRTFTKERHFNTHKCLASSSYVDISKKEIVKIDSDEEEGEKSLHLHLDDGAHEDDGEEYSAPIDENLRTAKEDEEDEEEMRKDDGDDYYTSGRKRPKKRGRRARSKAQLQGMTTVRANAQQMKNAVEAMENLPIFKSEEEKVAFEACVDVDLSQTDNMFRVHVIEQELNEMSGMVYNTPTVSSLSVYSCTVCEKVFKSLSHIRLHCVTHTDLKPFKCNRCDYSTNSKGNLYTHMRKHTGQFYRCEICDFKSVNKSHLIEHQMTHDSRRPQCLLCEKDYSTIKSLINHIRKYHTNKAGKEYLSTFLSGRGMKGNTIIHQCHVCNRKFKKRIDRDRHLFIHDIKDIPNVQQCDLCDYWASRRVYLDKHYLKHRVIYCCALCDLKYLSISRLSEHLNTEHTASGSLISDALLEECINRSYYLPEPVASTVEGSKYINLPEVLTDLNPESDQAGLDDLQLIDPNGSSSANADHLQNVMASQDNTIVEQRPSETNADPSGSDNVLTENCAAGEVNINQLEAAASSNQDTAYGFSSEYRDFINDNSQDSFPLDDATSKPDTNTGMSGQDGPYSEMLKNSEEVAVQPATETRLGSDCNYNESDKVSFVGKEEEEGGDNQREIEENNSEGLAPQEDEDESDLAAGQGLKVSPDIGMTCQEGTDEQYQEPSLEINPAAVATEKHDSDMSSMVLMLQNPGSDSDKEDDIMKAELVSGVEKEEDIIGKAQQMDVEQTSLDSLVDDKSNMNESIPEELSDGNNGIVAELGKGVTSGLTGVEEDQTDDKEADDNIPKVQLTDDKQKGTKDERISTLIKRLGYRHMTFDIFNKMRETFGTEECEYCGRLFYNKVDHETHIRTHTGDKPFACSHCSFRSSTRDGLRRHSEKEHEKIAYQCKECDFLAPTRTRLWNHQLKHLGITGLSCPQCTSKFDSMKQLRAHLLNSHKDMDKDAMEKLTGYIRKPQGKMGRRSFKCPHCPRVFIRANSELQKHIWIHEGIKPFACPICTYACRSKNNLQAHMLRHSSEKPFSCSECGKEYKSKTALRWHVRSHKAGKLFKCDKCPYEATQGSHLKRHMETHDVVKRFICKHCNFSANTLGYMKIHYAKHHKGQPFVHEESVPTKTGGTEKGVFKCLSCGYLFGNLSDLKRHLKIRHHVLMQDIAGMDQMQISEVEVVQYDESNPPLIDPGQRLPDGTVTSVLQPAQSGELQQIRPQSDDGSMPMSTVNLIQQLFGMSQGDSQVRVVSEDGEPLDISSETIILQQDGQLLMTTGDPNSVVSGNQYVIQYFNPGELTTQETPAAIEDAANTIQHVTPGTSEQIHLMNAPSDDQGQPTQFIITANGQTQIVTSSGPAQILSQADANSTGQLVFTTDGQTQLVADGQPQILTAGNNGGRHLISIDGQSQQLLTSDGDQFVSPEFESYSGQLISSDAGIVGEEEGMDVTTEGDKSVQEHQTSH